MSSTISETQFEFPGQTGRYQGKVRDVYEIDSSYIVIVTSDRISAFDHVLPRAIPYKGQVLTQTAEHFFHAVKDKVLTHLIAVPDPNVMVALACKPYPIEIIVRAYLAGHAWREYASGKREICGVPLPDGLKENDRLPEPIITPSTKSSIGHDEDISEQEILKSGIVDPDEWGEMKHNAMTLFQEGTQMAAKQGLILVDTKYEMGYRDGRIYLIDEIHTPDSSRYFYQEGYEERQSTGESQKQLSKEFVRKWLIENGFQGLEGQSMPTMDDAFVDSVSDRYIELYEKVTGKAFNKADMSDPQERIMDHTVPFIKQLLS